MQGLTPFRLRHQLERNVSVLMPLSMRYVHTTINIDDTRSHRSTRFELQTARQSTSFRIVGVNINSSCERDRVA